MAHSNRLLKIYPHCRCRVNRAHLFYDNCACVPVFGPAKTAAYARSGACQSLRRAWETLINSACPLAFRLGRIRLGCNQGVVSKACLDLSRNHNAECGPARTPRRASVQACICCVALLANRTTIGFTSRLAATRLSTRRGRVELISASLAATPCVFWHLEYSSQLSATGLTGIMARFHFSRSGACYAAYSPRSTYL